LVDRADAKIENGALHEIPPRFGKFGPSIGDALLSALRGGKMPSAIDIFSGRRAMDAGIGWIAAIIIGGIAGWLAEQFMKSDMGLLMNIVLGVVGAAIASAILSMFGIVLGGWLGYLVAGFIGACLLIWIVRVVRGTRPA
jgi:uncharacterized membrane protein YeaQ/YmgE (transglycosylase-associated protein family)